MSSEKEPELLDLEHDLPTTPADITAQRRLAHSRPLSRDQLQAFLEAWGSLSPEELRRRKGPRGEPFEL